MGGRSLLLLCLLAPALMLASPAGAQPEDHWADYPAREVERPSLPADGGFLLRAFFESTATEEVFDDDGDTQDIDGKYNLLDIDLRLSYGITDRWEVLFGIPYLTGEIGQANGGYMGDVYAGTRVGIILSENFELTAGALFSAPTGVSDYEIDDTGSKIVLENFRTGDPGYNIYPEIESRLNIGNASFRVRWVGVFTGEGEVDYSAYLESTEKVDADPGDGYMLDAGMYYQFTDMFLAGVFYYNEAIGETELDGEDFGDERELSLVRPSLMLQLPSHTDVEVGASVPLSGRNAPSAVPVFIRVFARF